MIYKDRIKKVCIVTSISLSFVVMVFICLVLIQLNVPCLTYKLLQVQCPGCGGTRMLKAIYRLDFKNAFLYNPFLFCTLPLLSVMYILESINYIRNGKLHNWLNKFLIYYAFLFIGFGFIRNFI